MPHGTRTIASWHVALNFGPKHQAPTTSETEHTNWQKPNGSSSAGTNVRVQCARSRSNKPRRARPASSRVVGVSSIDDRAAQGRGQLGFSGAAAMENLISLVNRLQRACTALGDHGEESALPTLWDSLPSIAVVGGQVWQATHLALFCPFSFLVLFFWRRCLGFWCGTLVCDGRLVVQSAFMRRLVVPDFKTLELLIIHLYQCGFGMPISIVCRYLWQSSGKSSVLESVVGKDFLPRGSGTFGFTVSIFWILKKLQHY